MSLFAASFVASSKRGGALLTTEKCIAAKLKVWGELRQCERNQEAKAVQDVHTGGETPIVGVMAEGADLVEAVAVTRFPVDGDDVTAFLARWITRLWLHPGLQAIVLGGITIAGLGVADLAALAKQMGVPTIAVSRRDPRGHRVADALRAAGLDARLAVIERTPEAFVSPTGLYLACAGASPEVSVALIGACLGKANVPEPLRLAHLIARAIAIGESRGRV